jgi:hypothetical protein
VAVVTVRLASDIEKCFSNVIKWPEDFDVCPDSTPSSTNASMGALGTARTAAEAHNPGRR